MQFSRYGLMNAEQRAPSLAPDLLVLHLLTAQDTFDFPAARPHCQLRLSSLPTRIPRVSSTEVPLSRQPPTCTIARDSSNVHNLAFVFIEFCEVHISPSGSLPPSEWQPCTSGLSTVPLLFNAISKPEERAPISSSKSWVMILNNTSPSTHHCGLHYFPQSPDRVQSINNRLS